MVNSGYYYV